MKFIRMYKDWGWEMWGLLGKDARWFFGYSKAVSLVDTAPKPRPWTEEEKQQARDALAYIKSCQDREKKCTQA